MESEGIVTKVEDGGAWVQLVSECDSCGESGGCGWKKGHRLQRFANTIGARTGDHVVIDAPDAAVFDAVLRCYLVPLLVVMVGAIGGAALYGDVGSIAGAAIGLAIGWWRLRFARGRIPSPEMKFKTSVMSHREIST